MFNYWIRAVLFIFTCQLFVGCSINTRVSYNDDEGKVPEDLIRKIKRKKTEKSWVLAHLGEPFAIDRVVTDEEHPQLLVDVYTFRLRKQTAKSGHAFYLLRAGGIEESTEYFHLAFENNRVKKAWMDAFPRPQIGTRIRHAKVNTIRVKPSVSKVSVQPQTSATNWKIPILKKWLSPNTPEPDATSQSFSARDSQDTAATNSSRSMTENTMATSASEANATIDTPLTSDTDALEQDDRL